MLVDIGELISLYVKIVNQRYDSAQDMCLFMNCHERTQAFPRCVHRTPNLIERGCKEEDYLGLLCLPIKEGILRPPYRTVVLTMPLMYLLAHLHRSP